MSKEKNMEKIFPKNKIKNNTYNVRKIIRISDATNYYNKCLS